MSQMILKIASLPDGYKTGISRSNQSGSGRGSRGFFSTIQRLMESVQKRSPHRYTEPTGAGSPPEGRYRFYLESLREGLLANGKPLNRVSLNSQDLPILKRFLYQCGLSQEGVERLLRELAGDNPHGGISLSQFFLKIAELGPPDRRIDQAITLEPSAIPYIESALRYFGLTLREIENALSAARAEGGGLDLDRFVIKIKEISNRIRGGTQTVIDRNSVQEISKNLQRAGIQLPDKGTGGIGIQTADNGKGEISIKDFITAIEQMTGRSAKGSQLPNDVRATIDQILERAVIANEKDGAISFTPSFSKPRLANLHSKEKIGSKGKSVEKQGLLSPLKEEGSINAKNGPQNTESPNPISKFRLLSDLDNGHARPPRLSPALRDDGGQGLKRGTTEQENLVKPETRIMDIPLDIRSSTFSETINTAKQNQVPVRGFLPAYVMDQVGKQISRSILRGERSIKLQLRPPELGLLKVEMDIKGNTLKLWMITENSAVKELLLSNVHELREALVEQGVKLDRLDIQINHNSGQSLANSRGGPKEGQGQGINEDPLMAEDDTDDGLSGPRDMVADGHLLDLVA